MVAALFLVALSYFSFGSLRIDLLRKLSNPDGACGGGRGHALFPRASLATHIAAQSGGNLGNPALHVRDRLQPGVFRVDYAHLCGAEQIAQAKDHVRTG